MRRTFIIIILAIILMVGGVWDIYKSHPLVNTEVAAVLAIVTATLLAGLLLVLDSNRRRIELFKGKTKLLEEVRESEERYRNLFKNSLDGSFTVDIEGKITSCNRTMEEILGYTTGELIALDYKDYMDPETADYVFQRYNELFRTGRPIHNLCYGIIRKDGKRRMVECSVSLIKKGKWVEGFQGSLRDVTEQKEMEATLRESEERYKAILEETRKTRDFLETIFETSPDMVTTTDKKGFITFVNQATIEALGYKREELLGMHASTFYDRGIERAREINDLLKRDEKFYNYRIKLIARGGREIPISISGAFLKNGKGEIIGTLGFSRDITAHIAAEEEIRKKNEELENFVYSVSHDLKAPVVSIQGFSSLLLANYSDKLDDNGKRYLTRIQINGTKMQMIIADLLEFSRVGMVVDSFENVSSREIISDALAIFGLQLEGLKVDIQQELPAIRGDRKRVCHVFENLLQNAIKYMGDTKTPTVKIGCEPGAEFHEFYVRDNGIGIDPKYHQKIFQIFQRLSDVNTEGTGIGLAIVKRVVENHGGRTRVESEKGKGTTIYFTLPNAV